VRALLVLLLCWPLAVLAVDRDLDDCTVGSTPTALAPLDLDACTISDGDDISGILTGLASTYGDVYVRAPSRTANVVAAYTAFTVDDFYFLEDEDGRNTLQISHRTSVNPASCVGAACAGYFRLWRFENFDNVVIGGSKLSITFVGNHPGLANCDVQDRPLTQLGYTQHAICDSQEALVQFWMDDGSTATLADFRGNVRFTQNYAIYTWGELDTYGNTTVDKITNFNVAGMFYATSGIFFHQGVVNAWADPDRTVLSDPYARSFGWDGTIADGQTEGGLPIGCNDKVRDQIRMNAFSGYYTSSITGGITMEFAGYAFVQRYSGTIGTAEQPFIVRLKDWHITGPGTIYPAGVRPKQTGEPILFKGDPHDAGADTTLRYVRFIKLPDTYGSGAASGYTTGCGVNSEQGADAGYNLMRFENSIGISRYTRGFQFELIGDWRTPAQGGTFSRGDLIRFGYDDYRSYNNIVRVASGTTIQDTLTMYDTDTVTGPGTFTNLTIADLNANNPGQDNTITDTNIAGVVTVSASTEDTTISNVNFTGTARAVITIGASANATVTDLCVPNGSTITGAGTLTYEGSGQSLPYTIPNSTANCSITADPRPGPVTGGSVN
jgi:hypothetical protein